MKTKLVLAFVAVLAFSQAEASAQDAFVWEHPRMRAHNLSETNLWIGNRVIPPGGSIDMIWPMIDTVELEVGLEGQTMVNWGEPTGWSNYEIIGRGTSVQVIETYSSSFWFWTGFAFYAPVGMFRLTKRYFRIASTE